MNSKKICGVCQKSKSVKETTKSSLFEIQIWSNETVSSLTLKKWPMLSVPKRFFDMLPLQFDISHCHVILINSQNASI